MTTTTASTAASLNTEKRKEEEDKKQLKEGIEAAAATTTPSSSSSTVTPSSTDYCWLKDKLTNPFSRIKASNVPTSTGPPEKASMEWKTSVKDRDSAIAWHLKWTPWFSPQMAEGIVNYGYKKDLAH